MNLRGLIQERMASPSLHLYNRLGELIPTEQVKREYQAIKNYLGTHHYGEADVIAIKATKDYRFFLTVVAAFELGVPYIPMMVDFPQDRVNQIFEDSQFSILVTDEMLGKMIEANLPEVELKNIEPDKMAYALFTSGSTGKPKGVAIPAKAINNFVDWCGSNFPQITSANHILQVTEFTFDISLTDVGLFIQKNCHVHFSDFNNDFYRLAHEIESLGITTITTVPNNLSMLLSDGMLDKANLTSLQSLMIAGARFSHGLYHKCIQHLGTELNIYNLYGPTECTVYSHGKKFAYDELLDCAGNNIAIGKTLPGVESIIVRDGKEVAQGEQGELLLTGIQLLSFYLNNPEKTREVLMDFNKKTYYRTGDIAFQDDKGDYYIVGRMDDTIKCRGFRVNLLDIDSYVNRLPYVEDCATIAIPHEITENQTIAFIRVKETKTAKELKQDLLQFIPSYQIPERIIFVSEYPTNDSGKICKKTLKANYLKTKEQAQV